MLALIEAAGVVGAGDLRQSGSLELGLEGVFQGLLASGVATTSFVAGFANVAADENMMGEGRHDDLHAGF